jgi:hypothetical protein
MGGQLAAGSQQSSATLRSQLLLNDLARRGGKRAGVGGKSAALREVG